MTEYRHEKDAFSIVELIDLLARCATWRIPVEIGDWRDLVANTSLLVTAWEGGKLIGFARLLTDFVRWAHFGEVVVDPAFQRRGIGGEMVRRLLEHPTVFRVRTFWVGTEDKFEFYERLGFRRDGDGHGMLLVRRHRDEELRVPDRDETRPPELPPNRPSSTFLARSLPATERRDPATIASQPLTRPTPMQAAAALHRERYPEARVVFLAGSIVRGEGTAHSDLDLVVVFARLDHAFRESFRWDGWPVEAFVHDAATLRYFFTEVDGPTGAVPLANMVREGLEVPASTAFSRALKDEARAVIDRGPAPWSEPDLRTRRYAITDLIDDLREPRSAAELVGAGARLHELLAEFYLRAGGRWSARGKAIPRRLHEADPTYAARFAEAFEDLLARLDPGPVLRLAEDTLRPYGGLLFEGHRLDAPPSWRRDGPGSTG